MNDRAMQHLENLSQKIGYRPIGTNANNAAAFYVTNVFRNAGLEVEIQEFDVPSWEPGYSFLYINGKKRPVRANTFSPPCDIEAEFFPFYTIEELESSADLSGKIALLLGELTKENLIAKGFTIYNPEHHQTLIRLLEQKNPSAIITVRLQTEDDSPIINDWDFHIPSITIPPELALQLLTQDKPAFVHLKIDTKRSPGKTKNIIGRRRGSKTERIILSAHYDTVFDAPGSFDNASGVSILLTLAEQIALRKDFETGFDFVAFSSEEYLGLGDQIYVQKNKADFQSALVAMNFDGVGQTLGTNNITLMSGSNELQQDLSALKNDFPGIQWTNPWYDSNHFTFFSNGIPSIPFSCNGVSNLLHTKKDQIAWISTNKLFEVYSLAFNIIENLQNKTVEWTREIKE